MITVNLSQTQVTFENGNTLFNDYLKDQSVGVDLLPCDFISKEQCENDIFWKDVACGKDLKGPSYMIFIRVPLERVKSLFLEEFLRDDYDFEIIKRIVKDICGYRKILEINKQRLEILTGTLSQIHVSSEVSNSEEKHYDFVSFVLNSQDDLYRAGICLPQKTNETSDWSLLFSTEGKSEEAIAKSKTRLVSKLDKAIASAVNSKNIYV